jgi:hypothetical protein
MYCSGRDSCVCNACDGCYFVLAGGTGFAEVEGHFSVPDLRLMPTEPAVRVTGGLSQD